MSDTQELEILKRYAIAANNRICVSQADIDPKDHVMPEMAEWCQQQRDIVVLQSGLILTSNPSSRNVQNCKIKLANMGILAGRVLPATSNLIHLMLANIKEAEDAPTLSLVPVSIQQQRLRLLIKEALAVGATDIHLEVREQTTRVRFRKHGELYLHAEWLARIGRELAAVAFNKETDYTNSHFNPLVPQNASMPLLVDDQEIRLRLASLPAHGGFDVVMRILTYGEQPAIQLSSLGYRDDQIALINKAVLRPHGTIIISGPTGSGKSTTLASCLQNVQNTRKIYAIEDPIEKLVSNASQIPVNVEKTDRDFASMGKAALRMDPDVIVLGETRDTETATVLMRAAITGHLVFTTIHTNNSFGIINRMLDLGVSANLLADNNVLVCLISQRLIPLLCQHCARPLLDCKMDKSLLQNYKEMFTDTLSSIKVRAQENCNHCHNTGICGRTVVAEIVWVDQRGRQYIQNADTFNWEQTLRAQGWLSYVEHAKQLVSQGLCDPFDAEKIVGDLQ